MTNKLVKTRFAPSPTGLIHLGNLRTALFSFLYAKAKGGLFLLRIEDTDQERSKEVYTEQLIEDLRWLSIQWDEGPIRQSERGAIYETYYNQLIEKGLAYPCYCSEIELALSRKIQLGAGKAPRYTGTCRHLSEKAQQAKIQQGITPTLRFQIPADPIAFVDGVQGAKQFDGSDIGDFIIRRSDLSPSFMFSNAVDDALMEVSHVIRGEDHLTNTPRQLAILKALGLEEPHYAHLPMIVGQDGKPLSKRNGSENIQTLREEGYLPLAIINHLARLGHHYIDQSFSTITRLAADFDLEKIGRSSAHFDAEQLKFWQKTGLSQLENQEMVDWMAPVLKNRVPEEAGNAFVEAIRSNILFPNEALHWAKRLFEAWDPKTVLESYSAIFAEVPSIFWENLSIWLNQAESTEPLNYSMCIQMLKEKTSLTGKKLFMPFRLVCTGESAGPELALLLPLIGKERMLARVKAFQQVINETI